MDTSSLIGISLYVLGGLSGAVFYLPFKAVKKWAWESYWMIYAVVGLVIVPWALAFAFFPQVLSVLKTAIQESPESLLWCYLFGAMWGLGGLTWGLMIRYLGVGLGLAVGCGLCASAGTLLPQVDQLGTLATVNWGMATLAGVGIAVLGIVTTGAAGMSKERELSEEQKKAAVAEFNFTKGILVAIFSGIMSAGMAFGLNGKASEAIEKAARSAYPESDRLWQGMPVLVVVLLGGFTVNFLWCLYLNIRNRTGRDYLDSNAPILGNLFFAGAAGAIWCSQFALLKVANVTIGQGLAFAGWTVLMSSMIIFSTILGILMGEWRGTSGRTRSLLTASLLILAASLGAISYGNYLKPETSEGTFVRFTSDAIVIKTDDGEKEIPLGEKPDVLIDGEPARLVDVKSQKEVKVIKPRTGSVKIEVQPSG